MHGLGRGMGLRLYVVRDYGEFMSGVEDCWALACLPLGGIRGLPDVTRRLWRSVRVSSGSAVVDTVWCR